MILSNKRITKVGPRQQRLVCLFVVRKHPKTGFLPARHICFSYGKAKITSLRQMLKKTCRTGKNIKTETQLNHAPALMQEDFAFPTEK